MNEWHEILQNAQVSIATAESCTGGNIAHHITVNPGSSAYFLGSVVAYHNTVKSTVLGVSESDLARFGAVSEPVALAMSSGVKKLMQSQYAIATTGIAGPSGGSPQKPVGTVWISIIGPQVHAAHKFIFEGDRLSIIEQSTQKGLKLLEKELKKDLKLSKKM